MSKNGLAVGQSSIVRSPSSDGSRLATAYKFSADRAKRGTAPQPVQLDAEGMISFKGKWNFRKLRKVSCLRLVRGMRNRFCVQYHTPFTDGIAAKGGEFAGEGGVAAGFVGSERGRAADRSEIGNVLW